MGSPPRPEEGLEWGCHQQPSLICKTPTRDRQLRRLTIVLAFARSARRLRRLVVVAVVVAVVVVAVTVPAGAADGFGDVAADAYYAGAVESLAGAGVFDGTECGDGEFCPDEPIERWVMAVWLIRVLGGDITASGTSRFADVDASEWWSPYAEELADRKITAGCATDPLRYCPDNSVTRAQMASFLVRAYDLEAAGPVGLTDTAGSRHEANIDALTAAGITKGCGKPSEQKFCPEERTSRAQMAVFLNRVRGLGGEEASGATDTGTVCVFGDRSDRVREAVWQVRTDGGIGTAFYIGDGEWLTAEHVVEGYGEVTLAWGGVELVATVEAVDAGVDLGLLTGAEPSGVQPLRLGDVTTVTAGSDVYVVGYPLYAARSAAVSRGVLSRIERWTVEDNDHWTNTNMVVTDAAANPGNSGGPLVDSCGRVIGVITSKQVDVSVEGLAYAVSDVTVRPFLVLARAGELDKGGSDSRVESNPEGNGSGNDDGAHRSDGWQWHEGENRIGTYVTARTWVTVDEDDWFIVGIRCTAREDLDVYFHRSSADMGEHERGYVEWRFSDQQTPAGYWGSLSTTGTAVFLDDDDVWVFIDDLRSDGSGWLYAAMWGYDSNGGYDWQGEGKLSVVGAPVVNDVLDACGSTANAEPAPEGPLIPALTLELDDGTTFVTTEAVRPTYYLFWAEW